MNSQQRTEIEAAAFRQLTAWLQQRSDVQNIELMILAGFCRNCLAKWYQAAALERGVEIDYPTAQEQIYGMPYATWKTEYQLPATPEQLAALATATKAHE